MSNTILKENKTSKGEVKMKIFNKEVVIKKETIKLLKSEGKKLALGFGVLMSFLLTIYISFKFTFTVFTILGIGALALFSYSIGCDLSKHPFFNKTKGDDK